MILKNQLKDECKAKLIIEGIEVYFETIPDKGKWTIKAKIEYTPEDVTPSLNEIIQSLDFVKIENGSLISFPEEGFIVLSLEMGDLFSFSLFKEAIKSYMNIYDFWKSILEDMIKSKNLSLI